MPGASFLFLTMTQIALIVSKIAVTVLCLVLDEDESIFKTKEHDADFR
jgi:hypothetical protein